MTAYHACLGPGRSWQWPRCPGLSAIRRLREPVLAQQPAAGEGCGVLAWAWQVEYYKMDSVPS